MKILLIDDLRNQEGATIARTFEDGLIYLAAESWDLLLLDHDLGNPDPDKNGYKILCWLEENTQHIPGEIMLVSANGSGMDQMKLVLMRWRRLGLI